MRNVIGKKIYTSRIRTIEIYTRLVCGWGEIYTSQYKYEACIKRKNYMEGLYKKLMIIVIGLFFLLYFSLFLASRRGVWCRVLYDAIQRHNRYLVRSGDP